MRILTERHGARESAPATRTLRRRRGSDPPAGLSTGGHDLTFGWSFEFSSADAGALGADLRMDDPETGTTVRYTDTVDWVIDPCA